VEDIRSSPTHLDRSNSRKIHFDLVSKVYISHQPQKGIEREIKDLLA
jgi:hypothetical protein